MSRTPSSPAAPAAHGRLRFGPARAVALGALSLSLLLAACGSSEDLGGKVAKDGLGCSVTEVDRSTEAPTVPKDVKVDKATSTVTETQADEDACTADNEKYLTLDAVGATVDGKEFTNTFGTDRPLTVRLGQNQLIAGLETGLTGLKVGERRQITIPAAEAYGKDGNEAQGIGADQDLVFVVDLVSITSSPTHCNEATNIPEGTREGKPTEVKMPVEAPVDEVTTTVLKEGDGPEATKKSYVTVEYAGFSCATGQQFDSSWDRDEPITVALADAEPTETAFSVIPGWSEGLVGQKQGSLVQIEIPFEDGYGAAGQPPSIGPSDPLVFVVEIVKVADEAPPAPTTTTVAGSTEDTTATTEAGQ